MDCDSDHEETQTNSPVTEASIENYDGTILPTANDSINSCGSEVTFGFIVGGHDAKKGAYPFIAALGIKNTKNPEKLDMIYICVGSLINRRYVVTAGVIVTDLFFVLDTLMAKFT